MQTEVSDVGALAEAIVSRGWERVGLDGVDGVGKSTLGAGLAELLSRRVINLDAHLLHQKQGGFAPYINYLALRNDFQQAGGFIVEGVCLLDVLSRAGATVDGHVYVKRVRHGYWADGDECVFPDGVEEAIRKAQADAQIFLEFQARREGRAHVPSDQPLELTEELMRYHEKFRPHEIAPIVFLRDDT